jgi:hypothetical protein
MKVEIDNDDLIIYPETEFERDYLMHFEQITGFAKYGVSRSKDFFIGLKIQKKPI